MNIKTAFYLLTFSLFFFSNGINGQNLFLKIAATNEKNNLELSKIQFQKKHLDITSIYKETAIIEKHLKSTGYYSVRVQKFLTAKDTIKVNYSLGTKIETALLFIDSLHFKLLKKFNIKDGILKTPAANLENTLMEITKQLDANGFSFSETSLKNTTIKGVVLSADLHIKQSQKRNINSIIVKLSLIHI